MTDGLPRRVRPTGLDGVVNQLRTQPGMASGRSKSLRPVPPRAATQQQPDSTAPDELGRLSVNWNTSDPATDLASRRHFISSWPSTFDSNGTSVGLNPGGDDGGIYFFVPGIYAVNIILEAAGIGESAADCSIRFQATIRDTPDSFELFDVGSRGGDLGGTSGEAPSPGASRIVYSAGGGVAAGGVGFDIVTMNLDPAVTIVWVLATVQQIA